MGLSRRRDRTVPCGYPELMNELSDYDFDLPKQLIAQRPVRNRADARLMVVDRQTGHIEHAHVRDLADHLSTNDCLVVNDSRVVPARLDGVRTSTGGRWQGLFLSDDGGGNWQLLCKTRGRLQEGEHLCVDGVRELRTSVVTQKRGHGAGTADATRVRKQWQGTSALDLRSHPQPDSGGRQVDPDARPRGSTPLF